MVLALGVLLGLAIGSLLGGRPGRLADLDLVALPLLGLAMLMQVIAFPSGVLPWHVSDHTATGLWVASYGLLLVIAYANRHVVGIPIVALGMMSNLAAILANDGKMPALASAQRGAGVDYGAAHNNSSTVAEPHLSWLIDRWAAPGFVPGANVYSVGDVIILLGTVVLVAAATGASLPFEIAWEEPEPEAHP